MKRLHLVRISHSFGVVLVLTGLMILSSLAQTTPTTAPVTSGKQVHKRSNQTLTKVETKAHGTGRPAAKATTPVSEHVQSSVVTTTEPSKTDTELAAASDDSSTLPAEDVTPAPDQPAPVCNCGGDLYPRCSDCLPKPKTPVCGGCGTRTDGISDNHILCPQVCLY